MMDDFLEDRKKKKKTVFEERALNKLFQFAFSPQIFDMKSCARHTYIIRMPCFKADLLPGIAW